MQAQENRDGAATGGGVGGLNGYFWEKHEFAKVLESFTMYTVHYYLK